MRASSVQHMTPGDQTIFGRPCPWLTYDETQVLQKIYPILPFREMGHIYRYKWLEPEVLNTVNMSDVNAHVSFISGHDTEINITTKELDPFSSYTTSGKENYYKS